MWLAIQRLCSKDADLSAVSTVALAPLSRACPRSILNTPRLTEATLHPRLSVLPLQLTHPRLVSASESARTNKRRVTKSQLSQQR
jgi:hypothetical protein